MLFVKESIPNFLSLLRIVGCVVPIYYFYHRLPGSLIVFLWIFGWTDALDGFLARRWNCASKLGAALDPIGDKLLTIVYLAGLYLVWGMAEVVLWFALIRDVCIVVGFIILRSQKKIIQAKPSFMGKMNTLVMGFYVLACLTSVYAHDSEYMFFLDLWRESFFVLILGTLSLSSIDYIKCGIKAYK